MTDLGEERRKQTRGVIAFTIELLSGKQSRKVAFGIWWMAIASFFRYRDLIDQQLWWYCSLSSGLLIGFGTVLDSVVKRLGDFLAAFLAERLAGLLKTGRREHDEHRDHDPQ